MGRRHPFESEKVFEDWAIGNGYKIYRNGWPDYVLERGKGKEREYLFVEVKTRKNPLTEDQKIIRTLVRRWGFKYKLFRISNVKKKAVEYGKVRADFLQKLQNQVSKRVTKSVTKPAVPSYCYGRKLRKGWITPLNKI